jgi:hypothetical protein
LIPKQRNFSPGKYPTHSLTSETDISELCLSTASEGCVDETISALELYSEIEQENDTILIELLKEISIDETIEWCIEKSPTNEMRQKLNEPIFQHLNTKVSNKTPFILDSIELINSLVEVMAQNKFSKASIMKPTILYEYLCLFISVPCESLIQK